MNNSIKYLSVFCLLICQCCNMGKHETRDVTGTYHWKYPIEFAGTLNEDNWIIIQKVNNKFEGLYYGTTDEFIDVREGYYPGYFVLPMDSLRINEDSIYFVLMPQTKDFFTQPISKDIFSTKEALSKGYSHWDNYDHFYFAKLKKYKGFFIDSVTLFFDKDSIYNIDSKKFLKVKK